MRCHDKWWNREVNPLLISYYVTLSSFYFSSSYPLFFWFLFSLYSPFYFLTLSFSILMAIKAYRDYGRAKKGITHPELVAPVTVHSAFDKACAYFGIKLVHVGLNAEYKADLRAIKNAVNKNTIAVCHPLLSIFLPLLPLRFN